MLLPRRPRRRGRITPAARRRCWTEPVIRFWLLATVALVGIGGWFFTARVIEARREQWLIANGTPVTATVSSVNGESRNGGKISAGFTLYFEIRLARSNH